MGSSTGHVASHGANAMGAALLLPARSKSGKGRRGATGGAEAGREEARGGGIWT